MAIRYWSWVLMLPTVCAIVLSGCSKTLDAKKVEEAIKADLSNQGKLSVKSITCPTGVKVQPGQSFECTGELDPDGGFFVTVHQEDDRGNVSWAVPNSWRLLNLSQLETEFKQALAAKSPNEPSVDCGGKLRATQPGDSFECKLVRQIKLNSKVKSEVKAKPGVTTKVSQPAKPLTSSATIVVRVQPEGNVTWQEVQTITVESTKPASGARSQNSDKTESTSKLPSAIGVKDETGWVQLGD
jgi:hypothetical protein